jgi:hypothetical protein
LWATPSVIYAETYNYSCKVDGKTYPLQVDDTKNILEWRGKKYSLTVNEDCGKYGWRAEGNGTSFGFCTSTQGYAAINDKDGNDQVQCDQIKPKSIAFHEPDICFSQSFKQQVIDAENKNPKHKLKIKHLTPSYETGEENPYLTKEAENECSYSAEFAEGSTQAIIVLLKKNGRFTVQYYE